MRSWTVVAVAVVGLCVPAFLAAPQAAAGEPVKGEWTGWITDTHCGKNGADKNHTVDCVEKCMKGGSKPQVWNEADQKAYNLDSFEKAKAFVGQKVVVKGTLDTATSTITVESVIKAKAAY